jgi:hypothetical protein
MAPGMLLTAKIIVAVDDHLTCDVNEWSLRYGKGW